MLSMFEQLHSRHTRAVNHMGSTTTSDVELLDGDDVVDLNTGMQPLLTFNH